MIDYRTADRIFETLLHDYGVTIHDRENEWFTHKYGLLGPCNIYDDVYNLDNDNDNDNDDNEKIPQIKKTSLSFDEIQELVNQRTIARRSRNYSEADRIRTLLTLEGIKLIDSENSWLSSDGKLKGIQSNDFDEWIDKKYKY